MINYIKGDLFEFEGDIIIHGCNCYKVMGAGIAKEIHQKYPGAYAADLNYGEYGDDSKLGTYSKWRGQHYFNHKINITVLNLYSQVYPNPKLNPFRYDAFEIGLVKILNDFPVETIATPKIGSGLAGGNWEKIEELINKVSGNRIINVYYL